MAGSWIVNMLYCTTGKEGGNQWMANDFRAMAEEFRQRMESLAQSTPDPGAIGAAVQEFVQRFVNATESGEGRRRRRRRDR